MKGAVRASVRVVADSSGKPNPERVRLVGEQLSELGFEVLRIGRRGISIEGEPERFEAVFGIHPEPARALTLEVHPRDARLKGMVDYLEVASEPVSFSR